MPVPARPRLQPDRLRDRADARRLSGRPRGVGRLHPALGHPDGAVRLRRRRHRGFAAGAGVLHGLKLVAVAIVAQAVWGMARSLCPDRPRASIAALSAAPGPAGLGLDRPDRRHRARAPSPASCCAAAARRSVPEAIAVPVSRRAGAAFLAAFALLLGAGAVRRAGVASWGCSTPSTAPARWCSGAAMSCCRCCATRW